MVLRVRYWTRQTPDGSPSATRTSTWLRAATRCLKSTKRPSTAIIEDERPIRAHIAGGPPSSEVRENGTYASGKPLGNARNRHSDSAEHH